MAQKKMQQLPKNYPTFGDILLEFKERFESVYGGTILLTKLKREQGRHVLALEGEWRPSQKLGIVVKWRGDIYLVSSIYRNPLVYTLAFEANYRPTSLKPESGPLHAEERREVENTTIAREGQPLVELLKALLQIPFERENRLARALQFFKENNNSQILYFMFHTLTKLAKGNYKGWHWWVETERLRHPSGAFDRIGVSCSLCFSKNGFVAKFPFQVVHNFIREENEKPYEISFLSFLLHDETVAGELILLPPFKAPWDRGLMMHNRVFSGMELRRYSRHMTAESEGGVVSAIEETARHAIDNILSFPSADIVDRKVLKAAAILYAVGFVLSTYLTSPNYSTIGYVYNMEGLPKVTSRPHETFEPHQRGVGTNYVVEWEFRVDFTVKRGEEYAWSFQEGVTMREISGRVDAEEGRTVVYFRVEPSPPFVPEITKIYNFDKSTDTLSNEEIKSALLDFVRALLPYMTEAVRHLAGDFRER